MRESYRAFVLVWRLEWLRAWRRRRLFRMNVAIPVLLVLPVAAGTAPRAHAAAVYAVLFALFGTFGAAIPALRDAERGLIRRLARAPLDNGGVLLGRAIADGCLDAVQLLPAVAIIVALDGGTADTVMLLAFVLPASLILANLLGLWLAAVARTVAEGALLCAVTTLLLLHASGVFRTPEPGSLGARVEAYAPFRTLHELLLGGQDVAASGLVAGLAALLAMTYAGAARLLAALAHADGRA